MAMWATARVLVLLCLPCSHAARVAAVQTRANVNASGGSEAQPAVETYAASDRNETSASSDCLSTRSDDYRGAVCAALKTGRLKDGESVDAEKMVALVARKGCTCTANELNEICGLAVVKVKRSPEDQCRHKLDERQTGLSDHVCAALKAGRLKNGSHVDANSIVDIIYGDKGVSCTASAYERMCGLAVVKVKRSPEDQCRHKLDERQTGLSDHVCAALKAGRLKNGSHVDANSIVDIIYGDKGVSCTASAYERMCGLPGAFYKKVKTCRSSLNHRQQGLAKAVCAALKDGTTKDGKSVNSHSMVDIIYGDKGIRCTADEYERMCSGMRCQASLIAKVDESFPREACDILGHDYEGSVVDEARLADAVFEEKGVRCDAEDFTEMCSSI